MACDLCNNACFECSHAAGCECAGAFAGAATLRAPTNRLGLPSIDTRLGDYASFFAEAKARLASTDAPTKPDANDANGANGANDANDAPEPPPLAALGTRDPTDPAIAFLDAWSVAADVLTFYRDRLANEGYLRTALHEDSLRLLAAGVGYRPRPGVAASVQLAYLLDPAAATVVVAAGAKAQTVPQPGEQMQTFETADDLEAHAAWSQMAPRLTRVPPIAAVDALTRATLMLADTSLFVRAGELVLFVFGPEQLEQVAREVADAQIDTANQRVVLTLKPLPGLTAGLAQSLLAAAEAFRRLAHAPESSSAARQSTAAKPLAQMALDAVTSYLLGGSAEDEARKLTYLRKDWPEDSTDAIDDCISVFRQVTAAPASMPSGERAATVDQVLSSVAKAANAQLPSSRLLRRDVVGGLQTGGPQRGALLKSTSPQLDALLYRAMDALPASGRQPATAPSVYLLRAVASPYGASAPQQITGTGERYATAEWQLASDDRHYAFLDSVVDGISADSYVLIDAPAPALATLAVASASATAQEPRPRARRFARVRATRTVGRADYGTSAKVTRLELVDANNPKTVIVAVPSLPAATRGQSREAARNDLSLLRETAYLVQSQAVELAAEPIADVVGGARLMLDRLCDGIDAGRWLIVAGQRADIAVDGVSIRGIQDGELMLVAGVAQEADPDSPGDTPHTVVTFDRPLVHTYLRRTVTIYGNVVGATHGETVSEVLGSGNARQRFPSFALSRAPLTFAAAATTSGVAGSEQVRVNTLLYDEVDSLLDAGPADRVYEMSTDGNGAATLTFGDGLTGARLPTGQENVRALYRVGIGSAGNVDPQQISLLSTRPLGVTGVINPLRASGGADRDGPERIRSSVPLAVRTLAPLSRLVSVSDYRYFAERFAGIGHASADNLADGAAQRVFVTLAGVGDNPLDLQDALLSSLRASYAAYGDPSLDVTLGVRELVALFIQARIALEPDADWNTVEPAVRAKVLDTFSFDNRQLGQPAYLSEVFAAIQATPGVAWTDVEKFGGIPEASLHDAGLFNAAVAALAGQTRGQPMVPCARARMTVPAGKAGASRPAPVFVPAQLAYVVPGVPATLVLNLN